jgi:hypothetical protein
MTSPETLQTLRRVVADFTLGVLVFVVVASCVAITEGQAAPSEWATTVSFAADRSSLSHLGNWHVSATALLALTFGALTAFNLSLARHVRTVAIAAAPQPSVQPSFK